MAPMVVDEQTDAERQMDQYLQEELAEPTPMQAFMESMGQGAPSGPYAGNSGFAGGLMQGAAGASRARNAQAARRVAAIKGRLEMERLRQKQKVKNDWKVADGTAYRTDPETGNLVTQSIGGDVEQRPENLPSGFDKWSDYNSAVNPIVTQFNKEISDYKTIGNQYRRAKSLIKSEGADLSRWSPSAGNALVNIVAKMLDPGGRVTDADAKMAAQGGGALGKLQGYVQAWEGKTNIPAPVIAQMLSVVDSFYDGVPDAVSRVEDRVTRRAERMGVRPDDIFESVDMPKRFDAKRYRKMKTGEVSLEDLPDPSTPEGMAEYGAAINEAANILGKDPDDVTVEEAIPFMRKK